MIGAEDYRTRDATDLLDLLRRREVSAAELRDAALAALAALPRLGAVSALAAPPSPEHPDEHPDGHQLEHPRDDRPLAGLPFAVKELLGWRGLPWTMGSRLFRGMTAPPPSPYAERLAGTGVHVVAATTSSELGLLGSTETALHGSTRNPWGERLSAGGSSGGAAALVAAGVLPVAHGNDAGGSLRVPASLCGVVGFKPSRWRTPSSLQDAGGFAALVVDHVITRTVRDTALVLGATERRSPSAPYPPVGPDVRVLARPLRIGVQRRTLLGHEPEPAVGRALERSVDALVGLGHDVVPAELDGVDGAALSRHFFTSAGVTVAQLVQHITAFRGGPPGDDELEPFTRDLAGWAACRSADEVAAGERAAAAAVAAHHAQLGAVDVVVSPTVATAPWHLGHLSPRLDRRTLVARTEHAVGYTPLHNLSGAPAISLPLQTDDRGLPLGIMLGAAPGADRVLLELALQLEEALPWHRRRPDTAWLAAAAPAGAVR